MEPSFLVPVWTVYRAPRHSGLTGTKEFPCGTGCLVPKREVPGKLGPLGYPVAMPETVFLVCPLILGILSFVLCCTGILAFLDLIFLLSLYLHIHSVHNTFVFNTFI